VTLNLAEMSVAKDPSVPYGLIYLLVFISQCSVVVQPSSYWALLSSCDHEFWPV